MVVTTVDVEGVVDRDCRKKLQIFRQYAKADCDDLTDHLRLIVLTMIRVCEYRRFSIKTMPFDFDRYLRSEALNDPFWSRRHLSFSAARQVLTKIIQPSRCDLLRTPPLSSIVCDRKTLLASQTSHRVAPQPLSGTRDNSSSPRRGVAKICSTSSFVVLPTLPTQKL